LLTSINNVYTADVANFQRWRTFFDEFVEIVYSRGQSCHIAGLSLSCTCSWPL